MLAIPRILLPVDFSERSAVAARYAAALARRFHSTVTALHAIPPPYPVFGPEGAAMDIAEYLEQTKQCARNELDKFCREHLEGVQTEALLEEGDPAHRIVDHAHDHQFGLIVMPTHGYGPFRRFILGSVTAKVLHDADCAVLTGAHLEEHMPPREVPVRSVVAAVDLGPQSERTLLWAAGFAEACSHARLVVVHATPSLEGQVGEYFDPDWRGQFAKAASNQVAKLLARTGVNAEVMIAEGDPAGVVKGAAEKQGADLVVIGRGASTGTFGRLRAHAYSIIRQSPCAVVSV
ncbi:MAG: universal stress protein [Bryobacteraceae bacterium]